MEWEFKFPAPRSSSEAMLNCKKCFCVFMSMQWTSAHAPLALLSLASICALWASLGQVGRGDSLCSQQSMKQLVFRGCRHCAQNLGPQVGANLNQTCSNQKLKNNREKKKKKTLPKSQPSPQPPKPYLQMQAVKTRRPHRICLPQLRGVSYPLFRGLLMCVC